MSTGEVGSQWRADRLLSREPRIRNARRCLFGPVDHDETKRLASEETEKQAILDRESWNFDFLVEQPLKGQFEWQACLDKDYEPKHFVESEKAAPSNVINGEMRRRNDGASTMHNNGQTYITDYMRKRKHSSNPRTTLESAGVKCARRSST